jgi:hypothetical protein
MLGARPESPNKDEAQVWRFGFGALPIGRHRFARLVARALPFASTDLLPCVDSKMRKIGLRFFAGLCRVDAVAAG